LFNALLKSQGIRQVFALGTGTAIGQAAVAAASPIWSRLYDPVAFGRYGLVLSFLSAATVAVSLRFDFAIPVAQDEDEALDLALLAMVCGIPVSLLAGVIFSFFSLRGLFGFGAISPLFAILIVLALLLAGSFSTLRYWHVRRSGFREISTSLMAQGLARALAPILLSPLNWGWFGLMSGELAGRSFGIRSLGRGVISQIARLARRVTISRLVDLSRKYRQYPLVFFPSSMLDALSGAVIIPVVVGIYGLSAGGEFLLAQQIVSTPSALICSSLGDVFHAQLNPGAGRNPAYLPQFVLRTAFRVLVVASVVYIPVACVAPFVAVPIFGAPWSRVGQFIAILAPSTIVATMVNPISRAILVSKIPQIKLLADVVKLVLPVLALIGAAHLPEASLTKSLMLYSGMVGVSYLIYLGVILISVRPSNQIPSVEQSSVQPSDESSTSS
jgi:O-antigen/teichoic acid export membrane protein